MKNRLKHIGLLNARCLLRGDKMASQKKIVEMITAIKTIYSYYAKDCDIELLVQTWGVLLRDYKDDVVDIAFYNAMQSCKVPPTPADIIERIKEMQKASDPTPESLWNELRAAIKETQKQMYYFRFNYIDNSGISQGDRARKKVDDVWDGLNEKLKSYLSSKEEMIAIARNDEDDLKYEKSRFLKTLPIIEKRIDDKKQFERLFTVNNNLLEK